MMTDAQATQWGIDQAFETLTMLTAHSDSAKGAMKFLRGEIARLQDDAARYRWIAANQADAMGLMLDAPVSDELSACIDARRDRA